MINASLAAAKPSDPLLRSRAAAELPQITKVKDNLAQRVVLVPFQAEEPVGADLLLALVEQRPVLKPARAVFPGVEPIA